MCGLTSGPTASFSMYMHGPGSKRAPLSASAITETAPFLPCRCRPVFGSTALMAAYHCDARCWRGQTPALGGLWHGFVQLRMKVLAWEMRVVPSRGSTAISICGEVPLPIFSPLQGHGLYQRCCFERA